VFNLGMSEIVVILVVALVFLGPKKLPELASGIGKMIRELRKATADIKNEIELDETIRKPVEELREAMTLHPEELKRRDLERAARKREEEEQAAREKAEKLAADKEAAEKALAEKAEKAAEKPVAPALANGMNADKTIAMESPFAANPNDTIVTAPASPNPASRPHPRHTPLSSPLPGLPPGAPSKVAGTVARPTLVGMPPPTRPPPTPATGIPRTTPASTPAAGPKLPPPPPGGRTVPSPPAKKD
jgi:sec-independent protein translocase protein TatB